ncbi:MAG: hypothetical protein VKK94_03950 [Cyanobacteriota bacterium]|nr:hypothetical protein [Cyanobacteriota bacterium]
MGWFHVRRRAARALLILMLAAKTAFADFSRLGALLATDGHLPQLMAFLGDRLVFQNGILLLILLAGVIIVFCKGDTTMAINLYAVGVFLAFTLSKSGMVVIRKFSSGAWLVVLLIPAIVWLLAVVQRRYEQLQQWLGLEGLILVCLDALNRGAIATVQQACSMSRNVTVLFVYAEHHEPERIQADWDRLMGSSPSLAFQLHESPYWILSRSTGGDDPATSAAGA